MILSCRMTARAESAFGFSGEPGTAKEAQASLLMTVVRAGDASAATDDGLYRSEVGGAHSSSSVGKR